MSSSCECFPPTTTIDPLAIRHFDNGKVLAHPVLDDTFHLRFIDLSQSQPETHVAINNPAFLSGCNSLLTIGVSNPFSISEIRFVIILPMVITVWVHCLLLKGTALMALIKQ